jgi:hypothetical protein
LISSISRLDDSKDFMQMQKVKEFRSDHKIRPIDGIVKARTDVRNLKRKIKTFLNSTYNLSEQFLRKNA